MCPRRLKDPLDLLRPHERPRGIVHRHIITLGGERRQPSRHRLLPFLSPRHDVAHLGERVFIQESAKAVPRLGPADDQYFIHARGRFEGRNRVHDDRPPA